MLSLVHSCWNFWKRFGDCLQWWLVSVFVTLHSAKYWMKAPKLVKTKKKANSRSQSQLQVRKCNFIEIPTGLISSFQKMPFFMICGAPNIPYNDTMLKSMEEWLEHFFLHQYVFATTVEYAYIYTAKFREKKLVAAFGGNWLNMMIWLPFVLIRESYI